MAQDSTLVASERMGGGGAGRLAGWLRLGTLAVCLFVGVVYIASSAYLGINGHASWRQALTYGHILGFTGDKGFMPFDLFTLSSGARFVFDMPLYQYLIAKASLLTGGDPLVMARFVNLVLWLLTAFAGYGLCRALSAAPASRAPSASAGTAFFLLLATSPLVLHYYSVPLPDTMALALALAGIALLHWNLWGGGAT